MKSLNYNKTGKVQVLQQGKNKNGYLKVILCKDGKQEGFLVHRLVANAFIKNDNLQEKIEVNHKDFNRQNNNVENLEWITPKENIQHSWNDKKRIEEHRKNMSETHKGHEVTEETRKKISETHKGNKNPKASKILCIETKQIFGTMKEASEWLGINYKKGVSNIGKCCRGEGKTAYGYHWKYID